MNYYFFEQINTYYKKSTNKLGSDSGGGVPGVTAPRSSSGGANKNGEARKPMTTKEELDQITKQKAQVLRQQQQRLLLLRHASKCKYGTPENPSTCPATKHCRDMKQLWQHITRCKNQRCDRAHCVSSRYVLSHYNRCKEDACSVCKPVRDAIHKHKSVQNGGTMAHYNPQQRQLMEQRRRHIAAANAQRQLQNGGGKFF